jgi:hypothetical protein
VWQRWSAATAPSVDVFLDPPAANGEVAPGSAVSVSNLAADPHHGLVIIAGRFQKVVFRQRINERKGRLPNSFTQHPIPWIGRAGCALRPRHHTSCQLLQAAELARQRRSWSQACAPLHEPSPVQD